MSLLKCATAYFNVYNALPFSLKGVPTKGGKSLLRRTWGWGGGGVGSSILRKRSDRVFPLPTPGEEVFVWLLRGRDAPWPLSRRWARPTMCRFGGERPANFTRDPRAGPGRGGSSSRAPPKPCSRSRGRVRPRTASGGLRGSEAPASAGRWELAEGGRGD